MNKRLISLLLVIVMIVTLLPLSVLAASNVRTVKASEDETPAENESASTIDDSEGLYTVSIVNASESSKPDVIGKTKYLVKYGDTEKVFSLDKGETASFKINDGDEYSVTYQGVSNRFTDSFKGMTMSSGNVDVNSVNKNWTHTLGQDMTNTFYHSDGSDAIVEAEDREVDGNNNVIKTNTKKSYSVNVSSSGFLFWTTYTCTLTNNDNSSEVYKGEGDSKNEAKNSAKSKLNSEFSKKYPSYSAYEAGNNYYIAEKLVSKTEVIECPADDVTLTFRSEISPITGNVSVSVYGPGFTNLINNMQGQNSTAQINTFTQGLADLTEPVPSVKLTLMEAEGQEDYQGRVYEVSEETESALGKLIGQLSSGLGSYIGLDASDMDVSSISKTYTLPEDVLSGSYILRVEKIDAAGVTLEDAKDREIEVEINNNTVEVGTDKAFLNLSGLQSIANFLGFGNLIKSLTSVKGLFLINNGSFSFTKVDAADQPLEAAEFYMVNREETEKIIKYAFNLGKDSFVRVIKNMSDENVFSWEEVVTLHTQLLKPEENNANKLTLNPEAIQKLIGTYIALITTVDGQKMDLEHPETINENLSKIINWDELRTLKIPAILKSVSAKDGKVEWSKASNVTTTVFMDMVKELIPRLTEALTQLGGNPSNPITPADVLEDTANSGTQMDMIQGILDLVLNENLAEGVVYNILWRMGILTEKLPAGHYILFESKAPEGHLRNPMFYTVVVEWKDDDWVYASVADAGLLVPYVAEGYYTYLRNINLADNADKLIYNMLKPFVYNEDDLAKYDTVYTDIVNNKVDASASMIKYVSEELWYYYSKQLPYKSEQELEKAMIQYLYNQGRTVQNLMVFAHDIAKRNKGVITGEMNEDWHVYNLEASIFKTWQKSTKAIMDRLSDSLAVGDIKLKDENGVVSNFKDLNPARWYYTAVKWVLENGIMAGVTTTDFRTATPVTRGMAVTVLYAAADYPEYVNNSPFPDVSKLRYFYNAVGWAYENGIVEGYPDGTFKPDRTLTRQELVQMLKNYCEVMDLDINDVDTGNQNGLDQKVDFGTVAGWAKNAMEWAFKVGAIFGLTEDTIDPLDVVTRAQMAQIVYKILTYEAPATAPSDTPADVPADSPDNTAPADNGENLPVGA